MAGGSTEACYPQVMNQSFTCVVDRLWEGCRESRRCSRDTYPESYITKYTIIRRLKVFRDWQALTNQLVEEGKRLEEAHAAAHLSMAQVRESS